MLTVAFPFEFSLSYRNFTAIEAVAILLKITTQPFPMSDTASDERLWASLWLMVPTQLAEGHWMSLHAVLPHLPLRRVCGRESSTSDKLVEDTPSLGHKGRCCFSPMAIQHGCCTGRCRGTESECQALHHQWGPATHSEGPLFCLFGLGQAGPASVL